MERPSTSPVERISGPSRGSTSGNMLNGNTASLTPKYGMFCSFKEDTGDGRPVSSEVIMSVAKGTMRMLHTLETSGTVREALGFASRT